MKIYLLSLGAGPLPRNGKFKHTFKLKATELKMLIDRTKFGLDWNAPLPKGGFALANEVKLLVELGAIVVEQSDEAPRLKERLALARIEVRATDLCGSVG